MLDVVDVNHLVLMGVLDVLENVHLHVMDVLVAVVNVWMDVKILVLLNVLKHVLILAVDNYLEK